jgi:hypothetical protein
MRSKVWRHEQFLFRGDRIDVAEHVAKPIDRVSWQTSGGSGFSEATERLVPDAFDLHSVAQVAIDVSTVK